MKRLFIIAGCNGAGKTTASFTILPEMLNCQEFVNADEIARGISPFQPETVAFAAGRVMLARLHDLLESGEDFALETTLASVTHLKLVEKAHAHGYAVSLVFFWLRSVEMAIGRVAKRVADGGHDIPEPDIIRRYERGIHNFFHK